MHSLRIPFPVPPWRALLSELRIDVKLHPPDVEKELAGLYQRLSRPGDAFYRLPVICMHFHGLVMRYRVADGEHYVYVEDVARRRLAGYVVFNRLIELDRRADPHLRAPHARFSADYQRRGLATAIYRWWLEAGNTLISGARQSAGAHALWRSLSRHYELFHVDLRDKRLRYLGYTVNERTRRDLHTRIVLLGREWDRERLAEHAGMLIEPGPGPDVSPVPLSRRVSRLF